MRPSMPFRTPIIRISNATFYRHHPNSQVIHPNPPLFSDLSFELPSSTETAPKWCVVGPSLSGKTTLLQVLRGGLLSQPPTARSFPYLSREAISSRLRNPSRAIRYVGFDADSPGLGVGNASTNTYMSARYESRRETTDFSLRDFLLGNTELNPSEASAGAADGAISPELLARVVRDLKLDHLLDLPVTFLSNGQGRRARIARALLTQPEVLLLDEPFMGLDPPTVAGLSPLLRSMADKSSPRLIMSARPQDPLPEWITHLVYLRSDCQVGSMGPKEAVLDGLKKYVRGVAAGTLSEDPHLPLHGLGDVGRILPSAELMSTQSPGESIAGISPASASSAEPLVEMNGCRVKYGDKVVLGNWSQKTAEGETKEGLVWTVRRGERWAVLGPNGSGKTTIVSLLCSDHPQTYSLPIKLFGQGRLPEPGQRPLTFWDIYRRIGHSSPEVHHHMPRTLTIRQVVANAWADTFRTTAKLDENAQRRVNAALEWFASELSPDRTTSSSGSDPLAWADEYMFGELSFSSQRVALFIRSMIKSPDLVVLDESFSGMDDAVRDKCMLFLNEGEAKTYRHGQIVESELQKRGQLTVPGLSDEQAVICIAHVKEEVPDFVKQWVCLPEANTGNAARFGVLDGPMREGDKRWHRVWGFS